MNSMAPFLLLKTPIWHFVLQQADQDQYFIVISLAFPLRLHTYYSSKHFPTYLLIAKACSNMKYMNDI